MDKMEKMLNGGSSGKCWRAWVLGKEEKLFFLRDRRDGKGWVVSREILE